MDNLDDSENNAKISDSAYSNSCSNSQSRRSHSSKSTHSGSNSSGSSGYGGKPSTSGYSSNNQAQEKRLKDKESKKKKTPKIQLQTTSDVQKMILCRPPVPVKEFEKPKEYQNDDTSIRASTGKYNKAREGNTITVSMALAPSGSHAEKAESMEIATTDMTICQDETGSGHSPMVTTMNIVANRPAVAENPDSFSCVISMHDGVVIYATPSITTALGFPKEMWIGKSFLDFVHTRDRNSFASQITSGIAMPKNVNGMIRPAPTQINSTSTMVCRLRRYRSLSTGFGVKDRSVTFMPFFLKLSFKNISDEEGKTIYLVIQATPFFSAFKVPNEVVDKAVPFVIRHTATGSLEYIDPESVQYLGFLPQDLVDKDALQLYHPQDLDYIQNVYETIVKEGSVSRCNAYRMLTQNGDYVKLETEWSSFINPWSKKLEFVIGKHHVIQGPSNPDVFQPPEPEKKFKHNDETKIRAQAKRENIVRIMNEVLTKPAEAAKQQMTKRCQDLATFMETLMEETVKNDDDLHVEIQEADHYNTRGSLAAQPLLFSPPITGAVRRPQVSDERPAFSDASYLSRHVWERSGYEPQERDSVMLGGISPHHDCNDSKSSTDTPISYNQLNYNETLQRYFDSHQPYSFEELNTGESMLGNKDPKRFDGNCISQNSGDSAGSSNDSSVMVVANMPSLATLDYVPKRLTESLLDKHNTEMEKELLRMHREQRSSTKSERDKSSMEARIKKKEHLARCNASYQPTTAGIFDMKPQPHGLKRASKHNDYESSAHKHHCSSQRHARRWQIPNSSTPPPPISISANNNMAGNAWVPASVNNMNTFFVGAMIPQQMSLVSPVATMPGMFPMYYAPATSTIVNNTQMNNGNPANPQFQQVPMQCMMYGQPVYGAPFMYSPITPQMSYAMPQTYMTNQHFQNPMNVGLANNNYEEACKQSIPMKSMPLAESAWANMGETDDQPSSDKARPRRPSHCSADVTSRELEPQSDNHGAKRKLEMSPEMVSTENNSPKSTQAMAGTRNVRKTNERERNNDDIVDKTDGESSYSSFYSSFFKTDSGSAEDSDARKVGSKEDSKGEESMSISGRGSRPSNYKPREHVKKVAKRKMEPPWMEEVCVTSELIYKYQVLTKSVDEVLSLDKQRMQHMEQPFLVNEQLSQLYMDLQLEGVAAKLTLEEGITSSGSSGEETSKSPKGKFTTRRKKREYSKLVMIYEEDAPLPPPSDDATSSSTS